MMKKIILGWLLIQCRYVSFCKGWQVMCHFFVDVMLIGGGAEGMMSSSSNLSSWPDAGSVSNAMPTSTGYSVLVYKCILTHSRNKTVF